MSRVYFFGCDSDYYSNQVSKLYNKKYADYETSPKKSIIMVSKTYDFDCDNDIIILLQDYDFPHDMKDVRSNILNFKIRKGSQPKIFIFDTNIARPNLLQCAKIFLEDDDIAYTHITQVRDNISNDAAITPEMIYKQLSEYLYPNTHSIQCFNMMLI